MILKNDIIIEGDERLKQKALEVQTPVAQEDIDLLKSMMEYIHNSVDEEISQKYELRPSVGLAAPQLGILKKIIAISAYNENDELEEYALINPKIISYSTELTYLATGEGCLSVDREVKGYVMRPRKVTFEALRLVDDQLIFVRIKLKGYLAVVFQHEYDHLQGILFPSRINNDNPFFIPKNAVAIGGEEE